MHETKPNCTICGAVILETTRDRTGGLCMPCLKRSVGLQAWSSEEPPPVSQAGDNGLKPACNLINVRHPADLRPILLGISDVCQHGFSRAYSLEILEAISDLGNSRHKKFRFFVAARGLAGYGTIQISALDSGLIEAIFTLPVFFVRILNEERRFGWREDMPLGIVD